MYEHSPNSRSMSVLTLSDAGRARRERMREALANEVRHRHAQRIVRRRAVSGAVFAGLVIMSWLAAPEFSRTALVEPIADAQRTGLQSPRTIIATIATDDDIAERLRIPTIKPAVNRLTDDDLLDALEAMGQPTGLIETNGSVRLARHRE